MDRLIHVTSAALPHLTIAAAQSDRGVADLVAISSTAGRVARPGSAFYSLAEFGINAFSESLQQDMLGKRVRVGSSSPELLTPRSPSTCLEELVRAVRRSRNCGRRT
ncbi:SDR family NAD(P)-dependent oxidoreductase [Nocardioides immobilis]|uniref:SDR family NAD(P)-dependent oxidoreductase n=1 Tax=Nocardioides immobilis TaxID=2049295 RepID=UPI001C715CE8|nr:SDR family NAD(P)-dependent oxidoreductase [Nocardioides immobilis]